MKNQKKWAAIMAETIMKRYPDPDSYPYGSWTYPQGQILWGMIWLWEETGDKKYYDYLFKYIDKHVDEKGDIARFQGISMDDIMPGSILVWAYKETGLEKYKIACDSIRNVFNTYPRNFDGSFWHGKGTPYEFWVDGLFMGQMFLSKYGKYIGDSEYCFDEAAKQAELLFIHCRKDDTGLLYHAWSEDKQPVWANNETGLSPEVWSEGLGWYAMILVEILEVFPKTHPKRNQLVMQLMLLLKSLKEHQDKESGLWYQVVDKGSLEDNWYDTSGSAMFVFAIKKAINLGIADEKTYGIVAEKGYNGIVSKAKINDDGYLDIYDACDGVCVQKDYDDYIDYPKVVNAKEAVGAFLWAAIVMEK